MITRKGAPKNIPGAVNKKVGKNPSMTRSITVAAQGFLLVVRLEKSVRRIIYTALIAVGAALYLRAQYLEILVLVFAWMITMTFEIFNTSLEKAMDYASGKEYHPLIKKGKDFAGASVFIASSFALILSAVIIANTIGIIEPEGNPETVLSAAR